ncbi:TonB-dependent receptor domain-containing protein [Rubrivirga sp. IMCC45206]|uniref:TonB-dependent receptor domain-containing protein n=1 Tax=Rubrivirga sp. IMCC45206 TaxID=3391614 RepID=UPI0039901379
MTLTTQRTHRGALGGALLLLLALVGAAPLAAQTATISGNVVAADSGEPLIGAAVQVVGAARGAATDINGDYTLDVNAGTHVLRASYTGYEPQDFTVTVAAGQTVTQAFTLDPDLTGLDEVVVTGALSSRSRSRSEVAVSRIDAAALTDVVPYNDFSQLVSGKVSGVSVQPASGNVGGGIRFNVRSGGGLNGAGQPLIYIDGVRISNAQFTGGAIGTGGQDVGVLSDINPDDIASVDILKGPAAAALYGTDASNGVVLITTKKGQIGGAGQAAAPFRINYQYVTGQNTQQTEYTELTADQTFEAANANFVDGGIQQHTVSVSGGAPSVRYFAQFDTRNEEGIMPGNYQDRRSLRANFEAFPLNNLSVSANAGYTFNTVGTPQNDNNLFGYLGNTLLSTRPYNFTDSLAIRAIDTQLRTNRFIGSFDARYTPIDNLQISGNVGIDAADTRQDQTLPVGFTYSGVPGFGERSISSRENDQISFQVDARYAYEPVDGLEMTTSAGVQGFDNRRRFFDFQIQNFATPLITDAGSGSDYQFSGEFFANERQLGLLAEQSLSFQDTYFAAFGLRNDYSSAIGSEAPSVVYPFGRAAVRLDKFAAVPSALSIFKLRAAYGESGQLPGGADAILLLYGAEVGGDGAGATPVNIGNPAIEPERVAEFEVGADLEIYDRVALEFTYYNQNASNSIFRELIAPSTGLIGTRPINIGEIDGQGIEFQISGTAVRTRNFGLELGAIANYSTNEVKSIGESQPSFDGFDANVIRAGVCLDDPNTPAPLCEGTVTSGLPRSAFYMTPVNGAIFGDDGSYAGVDAGITDANRAEYQARIDSGECVDLPGTSDDRCFMGIPYPEWNGSFTANITLFQDFTFYALADWATGLSVFNNTALFQSLFGNNFERNRLRDQLGFGSTDEIPDLTPGTAEYTEAAEAYARTSGSFDANYLEEADFLKLREISVRYNLGRFIGQVPALERVRTASIAFAARNLFTTSKYSGLDPEVNFAGALSASRGADFLTLQNPRQFFLTLQLGL